MADNLLDKASILLTPTAYDNGRMLSIKPNENLYGSEEVTNGDFATDSDWIKGTGWTISGGSANSNGTTSNLDQTSLATNVKYKVTITVSNITTGTLAVRLGGSNVDVLSLTENGTYTGYGLSSSTVFRLRAQSGFDGSIDNVSVVEDLSGDFNFERNSAATRVNAQGLVENVQIISSELVSNGNFSQIGTEEVLNGNFSQEGSELIVNGGFDTNTWWNVGQYWSIGNGFATRSVVGSELNYSISRNGLLTIGKTYKVIISVSSVQSGNVGVKLGETNSTSYTSAGTYIFYGTCTDNSSFKISPSDDFNGSIDNVSVKEVGQDWSLGSGWSIGEDKAISDGTVNTSVSQSNVFIIGKSYKVTISVNDVVGSLDARFWMGTGGDKININSQGDYTAYWKADGTDLLVTTLSGNTATYSITNISVKEVGQDWTLGSSNVFIQEGKAVYINQSSGDNGIYQNVLSQNKKYKVSFDVSNYQSGDITAWSGGSQNSLSNDVVSGNGLKTIKIENSGSTNGFLVFGNNSTGNYSLDNISVKEITDDTNIPRINYEGFSYQDTLGSEEIDLTIGSTIGSSWTSISKSSATYLGGGNNPSYYDTGFTVTSGLTYKLTFTISNYLGTDVLGFSTSGGVSSNARLSADGSYTEYFTASSNVELRLFGLNTNTGIFSNVSVKEVTGQEVVPDSGCGSWLLEPQSTNLIPYSEDFSQSNWSNFQSAITSSQINTLTNNDDATLFYPLYSSTYASLYDPSNLSLGIYTFSVFAKASGKDFLCIDDTFGGKNWFNLGNGTLGTINSSYTGNIQDFGNGWYRCSVTNNSDATFNYKVVYVVTDADNSTTITQNGIDGILLFGSQTEQQSYATSYIPTNGATNTRLQDIANNSGNSSLINSEEGVLYAEIAALANDSTLRKIQLNDNTGNNNITIDYYTSSNSIRANLWNGSSQYSYVCTLTDVTISTKVAFLYKSSEFKFYVNGIKVNESSSGSTFSSETLKSLDLSTSNGSFPFYGKAKAIAVYKEALTDEELQALTTI